MTYVLKTMISPSNELLFNIQYILYSFIIIITLSFNQFGQTSVFPRIIIMAKSYVDRQIRISHMKKNTNISFFN